MGRMSWAGPAGPVPPWLLPPCGPAASNQARGERAVEPSPNLQVPAPRPGKYRLVLDSDAVEYGGRGRIDRAVDHFSQARGWGEGRGGLLREASWGGGGGARREPSPPTSSQGRQPASKPRPRTLVGCARLTRWPSSTPCPCPTCPPHPNKTPGPSPCHAALPARVPRQGPGAAGRRAGPLRRGVRLPRLTPRFSALAGSGPAPIRSTAAAGARGRRDGMQREKSPEHGTEGGTMQRKRPGKGCVCGRAGAREAG